jgi:hypothetical protein
MGTIIATKKGACGLVMGERQMQLRASAIFFRNILQRATIAHVIYAIKLK